MFQHVRIPLHNAPCNVNAVHGTQTERQIASDLPENPTQALWNQAFESQDQDLARPLLYVQATPWLGLL